MSFIFNLIAPDSKKALKPNQEHEEDASYDEEKVPKPKKTTKKSTQKKKIRKGPKETGYKKQRDTRRKKDRFYSYN